MYRSGNIPFFTHRVELHNTLRLCRNCDLATLEIANLTACDTGFDTGKRLKWLI